MHENGFINYQAEIFDDAIMYFLDKREFGKYLAS